MRLLMLAALLVGCAHGLPRAIEFRYETQLPGGCEYAEQTLGRPLFSVSCGAKTCACDDGTITQTFTRGVLSCQEPRALFVVCGFPEWQ
jgi:hypothetical protein